MTCWIVICIINYTFFNLACPLTYCPFGMSTGDLFYGLRGVNRTYKPHAQRETTELLQTLTSKFKDMSTDMTVDPSKLSLLMFGLQNFSCDTSDRADSLVVRDLMKEITMKVSSSPPGWSGRAVGTALFGLRGANSEVQEVRLLIASLLEKLETEEIEFSLNTQEISNAIYGLQKMSSDHKEVKELLNFCREQLMNCDSRPFKGRELSNMLYGMHNMSSSNIEVRDLITVLVGKIAECTGEVTGQEIGNSLYSLRNMSSEYTEVRDLLTVLGTRIIKCETTLTSQEASNAIYGLKNMDSNCREVCSLVGVLVDRVESCEETFKAHEISMAIYGLQNMRSSSPEVRRMISVLGEKLDSCTEVFSAQNVGNTLYGLQNMVSSEEGVRNLLNKINRKIRNVTEELNEQNIGNSLYGLQNMSSECLEVRSLLSTLSNLMEKSSRVDLTSQAMSNALYGLRSMSTSHDEVLRMIEVLHIMVMRSSHAFNGKSFADAVYGLRGMNSESFEVRNLLSALRGKLLQSDLGLSLDALQISKAVSGFQNMNGKDSEVRDLLEVLYDKCFKGKDKDIEWDLDTLAIAIYGLKNMSADCHEATKLLSIFSERLDHIESPMTAIQISKIMFSLKEQTCANPATRRIVGLLGERVGSVDLDGQAVANCLYGLQNMSCGDAEVKEFLRQLCDNIDSSTTVTMSPQDIGNALYGLKSMTCEDEDVRRLISILCDAIVMNKQNFDSQSLSSCFVGLRGCHEKHVEVADILALLRKKLEGFKGSFTQLQLKNIFSGLRGMTSNSKDVQHILGILTDKLKSCRDDIDGQVVGEVLYGLQRMNVEHANVLSILHVLSTLVPKLSTAESSGIRNTTKRSSNTIVGNENFDIYSLGASFYGLASLSQIHVASTQDQSIGHIMDRMKSSGLIFHLIDSILAHGAIVSSKFALKSPQNDADYVVLDDIAGLPVSHCKSLLRSLNFVEAYLPQLPSSSADNIEVIRSNLKNKIDKPLTPVDGDRLSHPRNGALESIVETLRTHFESHPSVVITINEEMDSFDADITVTVCSPAEQRVTRPKYILNIEVEGQQHCYPTKRRFSFMRDTYLKKKNNIDVIRVHCNRDNLDDVISASVQLVNNNLNSV